METSLDLIYMWEVTFKSQITGENSTIQGFQLIVRYTYM